MDVKLLDYRIVLIGDEKENFVWFSNTAEGILFALTHTFWTSFMFVQGFYEHKTHSYLVQAYLLGWNVVVNFDRIIAKQVIENFKNALLTYSDWKQ